MRIRLLTITHKVPLWVKQGYEDYTKRLPFSCTLELVEISAEKRLPSTDLNRAIQKEGEKMLAKIHPHHLVIALDVQGEPVSTEGLTRHLASWQQEEKGVDLLVGGPEGLSPLCVKEAKKKWSLSALTFPHTLIRIIIAEQLYRATTLLKGHPYHR